MNLQPQPLNDTVLLHAHQVCVLSTLYCPPLALPSPSDNVPRFIHGDEHLRREISAHSNFRPTVHHNQPKPIQLP
jgi:hypothetical protein